MARSVALIANPASGRGRVGKLLPQLTERLSSLGVAFHVMGSRSPEHATELAAGAAASHEVVAAVGGDGMVHLVANGVLGSKAVFGIVPAGTGNDFATNLGYARRRPLDAAAVLAHGTVRAVDVGRIEGGPAFVCVAGGGFDSETNRLANRIRFLRGTPVYIAAVLRTLARFRPARFTLTLDGVTEETQAMFVAVGNAGSYGGGMRIAPDAVLDDGVFDVVIVGAMSRPALIGQFPKLFKGTHVQHPAVRVVRAKTVGIKADREFWLYADGEPIAPLPAEIRIDPGALRVLVPAVDSAP